MTHTEPDNYSNLASQFRPRTQEAMARAVHDLAERGFSDHTIAAITCLSTSIVREILGERRSQL